MNGDRHNRESTGLTGTVKGKRETKRDQKDSTLPFAVAILVAAGLIGAGLLAVAVAQSSRASFSLNAPASFPVDI